MTQVISVGSKAILGVEAEAETPVDPKWVFGRFRLWVQEEPLGDWHDTVTLRAVVNWWRSFVDDDHARWDERLTPLTAVEAVELLLASAFDDIDDPVRNAFARFDISHLGMSAFDKLRVIAIDHPDGLQILGWDVGGRVTAVELPAHSLELVGRDFIDAYAAAELPL